MSDSAATIWTWTASGARGRDDCPQARLIRAVS
jgi:hypothetical protein